MLTEIEPQADDFSRRSRIAHRCRTPLVNFTQMSHRYRLYPTDIQSQGLSGHCSHARYVWNLALEQANLYRPEWGPTPTPAMRQRQLAEARKETWLGQGSSSVFDLLPTTKVVGFLRWRQLTLPPLQKFSLPL